TDFLIAHQDTMLADPNALAAMVQSDDPLGFLLDTENPMAAELRGQIANDPSLIADAMQIMPRPEGVDAELWDMLKNVVSEQQGDIAALIASQPEAISALMQGDLSDPQTIQNVLELAGTAEGFQLVQGAVGAAAESG